VTYILAHWNWAIFGLGIAASFLVSFGAIVGWWFLLIGKKGPLWREVTQKDFERVKRSIKRGTN